MKKMTLILLVMLLCCFVSCGKEKKEPESITLKIKQIEEDYFLAHKLDSFEVTYKVYANLADDYCTGDNVTVIYEDRTDIEEGQVEITGIDINSVVDISNEVDFGNVKYKKPVIYLYPEKETNVSVQLDFQGELTETIPYYDGGWKVTAYPDGTLVDQNGLIYPYLFWEGESDSKFDLSQGFCVSGEDIQGFLREKLELMGLNEKELTEFIEYWAPFMEKNPYNKISFQTKAYTDNAKLIVDPEPDSVIRIFMVYQASDCFVEIKEQTLPKSERTGFVLVEWGGCEISK